MFSPVMESLAPIYPILPIPPFEQFGVVYGVVRIVDGTAENIEYAAVDLNAFLSAVFIVHALRISSPKIRNILDSQIFQILGDTRSDTGNLL